MQGTETLVSERHLGRSPDTGRAGGEGGEDRDWGKEERGGRGDVGGGGVPAGRPVGREGADWPASSRPGLGPKCPASSG